MSAPTVQQLYDVTHATWPAKSARDLDGITLRKGLGGGSRVSAATADAQVTQQALEQAEAAMRAMGQTPLFMIREGDDALDAALAGRGYAVKDKVWLYAIPAAALTKTPLPPVTTFRVWPPLQIAQDIWAEGGIGPARIDVMRRVDGSKTALLGRTSDAPAAAGFVAMHGDVAMLHALEVRSEHRRKNMGAQMTRAAAFWAVENGGTYLSLIVTQANTGANALYQSLGLRRVGQYHYRILPS